MTSANVLCEDGCPENSDRNCPYYSDKDDNEATQCVDKWAEEKFYYLENYLNATWGARNKFSKNNNAVFIDLFAGPGKSIIRVEQKIIKGGALRAISREKAAFNKIILNDISSANYTALKKRIPNADIYNEDANKIVEYIVNMLKKEKFEKYHFAYLDPFAPSHLKFSTIESLSRLKRLDIMINFPIGSIRRNYKKWINDKDSILDSFLGTSEWRLEVRKVSEEHFCEVILSIYIKQLVALGFPLEGLGLIDEHGKDYVGPSIVTVKNSKSVVLYYLIFASKHKLAAKIWKSILKIDPKGQRSLF